MDNITLNLDTNGNGRLLIMNEEEKIAEMTISSGDYISVYHTEVSPKAKGQGLAKKLLDALAAYAREQCCLINPLCPFVKEQFERHPEEYSDIWKKDGFKKQ